jgi:hypothetical protein
MLETLDRLWRQLWPLLKPREQVFRVHVTLLELTPVSERQLDFLSDDDILRRKWESASIAIDRINAKYGKTLTSMVPGDRRPAAMRAARSALRASPERRISGELESRSASYDLDAGTPLECTCRKCGHVHYEDSTDLMRRDGFAQLYLDEVESRPRCSARDKCALRWSMTIGRALWAGWRDKHE